MCSSSFSELVPPYLKAMIWSLWTSSSAFELTFLTLYLSLQTSACWNFADGKFFLTSCHHLHWDLRNCALAESRKCNIRIFDWLKWESAIRTRLKSWNLLHTFATRPTMDKEIRKGVVVYCYLTTNRCLV